MSEPPSDDRPAARRAWVIQIAAIAPIVLFFATLAFFPMVRESLREGLDLLIAQDREALVEWAKDRGMWAPLATTVLMVVQGIAAPIPAVVVTFANSLLFGWVWGGILSIASANLAASVCYLLGRAWGEPVARRLVRERSWARSKAFLAEHGHSTVLVARLVPLVPFDPISYLAGVTGMRFRTFFFATLIGQIPAGMAYSWLATQIEQPRNFVLAALSILAALVVVGLLVRRALRRPEKESASAESGSS